MNIKTIESLGPILSDDARAALVDADVIIGVDIQTQREFTVFGLPPLESTVNFKKPSAMKIVRVGINGNTEGLESLSALVSALKGLQGHRTHAPNT
jgi:hypothetical protein